MKKVHWFLLFLGILGVMMLASGCGQQPSGAEVAKDEKATEPSPQADADMQNQFRIVRNEIDHWVGRGEKIGDDHYERLRVLLQELERQGLAKDDVYAYMEKLESLKFKEPEKTPPGGAAQEKEAPKAESKELSKEPVKKIPEGPVVNTWVLPFEISESFDKKTKSLGDVSFAGTWVMIPFGKDFGEYRNPDVWFELVPGTILKASYSGKVSVNKNPSFRTPEGELVEANDWEVFILFDDGHWIEYDHVVELMISDGDFVEIGQPLGKAAPAYMRHGGGIEKEKPVDEIEWGVRKGGRTATAVCPFKYLKEEEQGKLLLILETMNGQGFETPKEVCLVEEVS